MEYRVIVISEDTDLRTYIDDLANDMTEDEKPIAVSIVKGVTEDSTPVYILSNMPIPVEDYEYLGDWLGVLTFKVKMSSIGVHSMVDLGTTIMGV